ncbi:MAG TPA: PilN domain-containing protein [Thermodesulfobacteriota bacterium]
MIRINLLPSEQKKEARALGDLIVGGLVIFAVIVSILALHLYQAKALRDVNKETLRVEKRIKELEDVKEKVEAFKAKNAELERRIKLIQLLEQNRAAQLNVMESLAEAIPQRAWIDKFTETGDKAKVEGIAWNEFTVSDFMKSLKSSNYFKDVELVSIQKKEMQNLPLRSFVIESNLSYSGKVEEGSEDTEKTEKGKNKANL